MGVENFELKPIKAERRDSAELIRDIEAARELKQELDGFQNTDVVGRQALEDLEALVAEYTKATKGLTPEQMQANGLVLVPRGTY